MAQAVTTTFAYKDEDALREDKDDQRVFVIDSVYGNLTLLKSTLDAIEYYPVAKNDKVILLGNFIGSYGNTHDMIRFVKNYKMRRPSMFIPLMGRNEYNFVRAGHSLVKENTNYYMDYAENDSSSIKNIVDDRIFISHLGQFASSKNILVTTSGINPKKSLKDQVVAQFMYRCDELTATTDLSKLGVTLIRGMRSVKDSSFDLTKPYETVNHICVNTAQPGDKLNKLVFAAVYSNKKNKLDNFIEAFA